MIDKSGALHRGYHLHIPINKHRRIYTQYIYIYVRDFSTRFTRRVPKAIKSKLLNKGNFMKQITNSAV